MTADAVEIEIDLTERVTGRAWGRVAVLDAGSPTPPTIGRVSAGVHLFTRGRRHSIYGDPEAGKSRLGYLTSVQEITSGHAVVVLNGEMEDEDVKDWLMTCEPAPSEEDITDGLFVYPTDGLLTETQRRKILDDVAASGRMLTFVLADSATSLLSEAGLNPNAAEDIERLWTELGGWLCDLPSKPGFAMTDHLSKGGDGSSATGSIRKHGVVDVALHVHNEMAFSPTTQYGPAVSGFSTVKITKGRRGGRNRVVARIVGHEERVRLMSPNEDLPWVRSDGGAAVDDEGSVSAEVLALLRAVARAPEGTGSDGVLALAGMKSTAGYRLLREIAVDEAAAGPSALLIRRRVGKSRVPQLTDRGRALL